MTFNAWRITKQKHTKNAFDGAGARKYGGRWNSPGTTIVYTAQFQSLVVLEVMVHLNGPELLQHYVLIPVAIEDELVRKVREADLPQDWRAHPAPLSVKQIGDDWARSASSAVLQVPSALLPSESNFLLNPAHADFKKLIIGEPVAFRFDSRLLQ